MNFIHYGHGQKKNQDIESWYNFSLVPEDELLDHLLDQYSNEIYPNFFILSSFDLQTPLHGFLHKFPKQAVKIGKVYHCFNKLFLQSDIEVYTEIYVKKHQYENVFALMIKSNLEELKGIIDCDCSRLEYVQTNFFREANSRDRISLTKNPKMIEIMLLVLFYKMGITGHSFLFEPSKTAIGKNLSQRFIDLIHHFYEEIDSPESFGKQLKKTYPNLFI